MTTNTTSKKPTKRDYFNALYTHFQETGRNCGTISADSMMDFIEHELELLAKKNSADKKPSKEQIANATASANLLEWMEIGKAYTIGDLIKNCPVCEGLSNPKVTALLRPLKDNGSVERTEEKRKVYFTRLA